MGQDRLDLGRKNQTAVYLRKEQRLYAHSVPGKEYAALLLFPNRKSKYTVEFIQTRIRPLPIAVQHNFRVRMPSEAVAQSNQLLPEFGSIV